MCRPLFTELTLTTTVSSVITRPSIEDVLAPLSDGERKRAIDLVVCDTNTVNLIPANYGGDRVVVPAGEACKTFEVLRAVLVAFGEHHLTRQSVIAAVGGGAVTDLGALAASVYLRGIRCVLVPTSLLAMVDAAIGGKTGIDFEGYKNLIGTFAPAREVRIVPRFLSTLSEREFRSGLAEVLKAGFLADPKLVEIATTRREEVARGDIEVVTSLIERAIAVKVAIVSRDFREGGERANLNLGHTFGHALESCSGLGVWTHGEAVAWGMARAAVCAQQLGIDQGGWASRVSALLADYGYSTAPLSREVPLSRYMAAILRDKKRADQGVSFVLQSGPQRTVRRVLRREEIERAVYGAAR